MVCESVETMVVHSSCEKFCSKEEQKIEVTTDIRTWGEGGVGEMCTMAFSRVSTGDSVTLHLVR